MYTHTRKRNIIVGEFFQSSRILYSFNRIKCSSVRWIISIQPYILASFPGRGLISMCNMHPNLHRVRTDGQHERGGIESGVVGQHIVYSVSIAVISDGESVGPQELHGAGWYAPRDHQASHTHQTIVCDWYQVCMG